MSLYCFGKVVPLSAKNALEMCVPDENSACLHLCDIDPEDLATICEFNVLKPVGVTFRYVSNVDISDATTLWLAASEVAGRFSEAERNLIGVGYVDAIKATALGGFIHNLLNCPEVNHGALALVDGGVETIFPKSSDECWRHFLTIISKPWDCHDNPLFVWSRS
jgi:hypothetical protein